MSFLECNRGPGVQHEDIQTYPKRFLGKTTKYMEIETRGVGLVVKGFRQYCPDRVFVFVYSLFLRYYYFF